MVQTPELLVSFKYLFLFSLCVLILGPSSPAPIQQFTVYGLSFELAIIQWIVPRITYTPETYRVIYRQGLDGDVNTTMQVSDLVMGTTNLSAMNTVYSEVIRNLQPNSFYSYQIAASNTQVTRFTQESSFSTSSSGN